MTPEEQRIALAEWRGAKVISKVFYDYGGARAEKWAWDGDENTPCAYPGGGLYGLGWNKKASISELPDCLNDLNAVHELEEKLSDKQKRSYAFILAQVLDTTPTVDLDDQFLNLHATAAQKCEAILKTLNLWKP